MGNFMGMDIETLRTVSMMGMLGGTMLYAYRLFCLVDLMKSESEKLAGNNRLIYAGLIVFIPLGIGGWLYQYVVNEQKGSPAFIIPFLITTISFAVGILEIIPHATNFNLDFISW